MSEAKKISELETGEITENSYFLNTIIDSVNGNSSTKVGIDGMKNALSNTVVIDLTNFSYIEDINELPEGITAEYIYNLEHSGKTVILACGNDDDDGIGTYYIPITLVQKSSNDYYANAWLTIPAFSGNPSKVTNMDFYYITIHNGNINVNYDSFTIPTTT